MSDVPEDFDEAELLTDYEAAHQVGKKVIEAAQRVANVHAVHPGAEASWHFEIEDRRFKVVVSVVE